MFHTDYLVDNIFRWSSAKKETLPPILRDHVISGYRYAKPQFQVMPTVFSEEELRNFKKPTLLLIGENEVIYPAAKAIAYAKKCITNLEAHVIPGANHSFTLEHADIINEHMTRFLSDRTY